MDYQSSLIGFHNPYTMKKWTSERFLNAYIFSQKNMFRKHNGYERKKLVDWIKSNWKNQLLFVERLFPDTLIATPEKLEGRPDRQEPTPRATESLKTDGEART